MIRNSSSIDVSWLSGRSRAVPHRSLSRRLLPNRILLAFALVSTVLCLPTLAVSARTLDQAIQFLLDDDCLGLTGGGLAPGIGLDLNSICTFNGSGVGNASGGGTGSAQSLGASVENRRQDRLEGEPTGNQATLNLSSGLGLFISGNIEALDRDRTTFGDGFDSNVLGATIGGDFRFNDHLLTGMALNYSNRDGDFDGGGDFSTNSYGVLAYGSVMPIPAIFLDISLGYTRHN